MPPSIKRCQKIWYFCCAAAKVVRQYGTFVAEQQKLSENFSVSGKICPKLRYFCLNCISSPKICYRYTTFTVRLQNLFKIENIVQKRGTCVVRSLKLSENMATLLKTKIRARQSDYSPFSFRETPLPRSETRRSKIFLDGRFNIFYTGVLAKNLPKMTFFRSTVSQTYYFLQATPEKF